jgi:protein SCO1/2
MRRTTPWFTLGALFLVLAACSRPALKGTSVLSSQPAPDFSLTDQHGTAFHLKDTRGKVVLMSFIYTHCTDLCPFITLKVKESIPLLGKDADRAVFLAVTTDPERDTQPVIDAYSREAGLEDSWHFLTGSLPELQEVWHDYGVGVEITQPEDASPAASAKPAKPAAAAESAPPPTQGLSSDDLTLAGRLIDAFGGGYEVSHTAPFWFIDPKGKIRAVMDADASPADIAANITALLHGA